MAKSWQKGVETQDIHHIYSWSLSGETDHDVTHIVSSGSWPTDGETIALCQLWYLPQTTVTPVAPIAQHNNTVVLGYMAQGQI